MDNLQQFLVDNTDKVPKDFDWNFYVTYYADLSQADINNEILAKYHYIMYGKDEKRLYKSDKHHKVNKIFQIGFNKCGTNSFHKLFHTHALIPSIHWDDGLLGNKIHNNLHSGEYLPLEGYDQYSFFSDMESFVENQDGEIQFISVAQQYFDLLDINYPNSVFILNTRNIDNWIISRLKHMCDHSPIKNNSTKLLKTPIKYVDMFKSVYQTKNEIDIINLWKKDWIEHHNNVIEYFSRSPESLLIYDIEKDDISKIKRFFSIRNIHFDTDIFPHEYRTNN